MPARFFGCFVVENVTAYDIIATCIDKGGTPRRLSIGYFEDRIDKGKDPFPNVSDIPLPGHAYHIGGSFIHHPDRLPTVQILTKTN